MQEKFRTMANFLVEGDDKLIVKKLEIPLHVKKLETLLKRLPEQHLNYQVVKDHLARQIAGYNGEKDLGYYLNFLPDEKYFIFHDLRLFNGKNFFQMDIQILSPRFILILEVKNISGILLFDSNFDQLIRTINEKDERFKNPILQVKQHQRQLKDWLITHKIPSVPIEALVVIQNPRTILKATSNHPAISQKVIHSENLQTRISTFENRYPNEVLTDKEIRKLTRLLMKKHTPNDPNILQQYNISEKELLKGVHCPKCSSLPMKKIHGKWLCPVCQHTSNNAHIPALKDYCFLISSSITNKDARDFLQVASGSVVKRIFHSMNLQYEGELKTRKYFLTF
ncbi:NERD domain-containing protein [Bacillus sp. 03113]|uniref:NERD domain-containing protein n=1 Tax=Bacillus sp. 03113 TaxID=2578211 RepID=UPI0011440EAA|nr:NERD domain-containing protein [Bacillus sp. 03113]